MTKSKKANSGLQFSCPLGLVPPDIKIVCLSSQHPPIHVYQRTSYSAGPYNIVCKAVWILNVTFNEHDIVLYRIMMIG